MDIDYNRLLDNNIIIKSSQITKENWLSHFTSILNFVRDYIETDYVQDRFLKVIFEDGTDVELSVVDYIINIIMWKPIVHIGKIQPKHLLFDYAITRKSIKDYIDRFIIEKQRGKVTNIEINNLIDDTLKSFKFIDEFSFYLCNTINLEDDIKLMRDNKEVYDIFNASLAHLPINEVNKEATKLTNKLIKYIINSDHSMKYYFISNEGINRKQYKEYAVNIGPKPDGKGNIFPAIIDNSFINGGLKSIESIFIENSAGRVAQILSKNNVGDSGHFARLLGLNNSDTYFHSDKDYVCDTQNLQEVFIKDENMLNKFKHRYYRIIKNGVERKILYNGSRELIGKTIYLRSPITCASNARGDGVCYRCYGDLTYNNNDINPGKIATQLLSSILTQILLSAKHLLEAAVQKIEWVSKFNDIFTVDMNVVSVIEDLNENFTLIIDLDQIIPENEEDNFDFNEYIISFEIKDRFDKTFEITTSGDNKLYITEELNTIIRKNILSSESKVEIPSVSINEIALFMVRIHNNELSKTLDKLKNIIDLSSITKEFNRHQILQEFILTLLDGNLEIDAVHAEIIISNQIRVTNDAKNPNILERPQWEIPNVPYSILTLHQSLSKHPSLAVSLSFEGLSRQLYNPLTYLKKNISNMDLFFHPQPQVYVEKK